VRQPIVRNLWTLWLSKLDSRLREPDLLDKDAVEGKEKVEEPVTSEDDSDEGLGAGKDDQARNRIPESHPKLIDTIALIYMGIVMLRRPMRQATLLAWILDEQLPFIRAIRYVPQDMKDRLPGEYHASLDTTTTLPVPEDVQKAIYNRVLWYDVSFGMVLPSINQNLVLLEYVRELALPLEVYAMARRLNSITGYTFAYSSTESATQGIRRHPTTYPEAQLMALVVVATKLIFPFDSDQVKRYPKHPTDEATLRMDWSAWLEAKSDFDKAINAHFDTTVMRHGTRMHVTDNDVLEMTDQQLDEYMDWYQRTWIPTSDRPPNSQAQENAVLDKEILDMFPLAHVQEPTISREQYDQSQSERKAHLDERIKQVQSTLRPRRAVSGDEEYEHGLELLRPGAMYPRYTKVVDLEDGKDGGVVKVFHEEAARTACLGLKALLLAVTSTEEKIERWLHDRRREETFQEIPAAEGVIDDEMRDEDEEMQMLPETSPPARLARDLSGLDIGLSPQNQDSQDIDMG
jgi:RNA polymerase I-specific transcription initiation factor RRN7